MNSLNIVSAEGYWTAPDILTGKQGFQIAGLTNLDPEPTPLQHFLWA